VSEYLAEIYPNFGSQLLQWMKRIFKTFIFARKRSVSNTMLDPQSLHLQVPRPNKPTKKPTIFPFGLLTRILSHQEEVIITGILEAQSLTLLVSAESEASMLQVKSALTWMLAVLQPRTKNVEGLFYLALDQNSLERGLPKLTEFKPEKLDRYCWMELFDYAVVVEIPLSVEVTVDSDAEGLEVELNLLVELAAVDRQATIMGGATMMYGFDTAIVPLEPAEARRWHFMRTEGRQITPRRAEIELTKRKLDAKLLANEYLPGKVYIGWCPNPVVSICSKAMNTFAGEVIKPSGVPPATKLEEQSERNSSRHLSFTPRLGILGSSLGFSSGAIKEKKYSGVVLIAARKREQNFERVLTSAMGTPSILWDSRNKKAWLLPVISVLAFASLRYIEWQKYTFQKEKNGKLEKTDICYSTEMKSTGSEAQTILRRNRSLLVDTADGQPICEQLTFEKIARVIWEGMCDGEDLCTSDLSGLNFQDDGGVFGYDLSEAMYQKRVQLRKLQCFPTMKSWLPLCQDHRVQVIFSQYVGRVLSCRCDDVNGSAAATRDGTLTCLLDDLRSFYGPKWSMLAQDACLNGLRLPIGEKFEWIPWGYAGESRRPCSHRTLQSISEKPNKKLRRKRLMEATIIQLPSDECLICFG